MSILSSRGRGFLAIYAIFTVVCAILAPAGTFTTHTQYNHYALLADDWLHGRLDMGGPPPPYAGQNDFAMIDGRWFVSFPPFPAVLLTPFVAISGGPLTTRDGAFFLLIAGLGPAILFLALERLSERARSERTRGENFALALLFAFGTLYFSTAIQGTTWFAGHVVGVVLMAIYIYASIDAELPVLAGAAIVLAFATRPSLGYAFPLFLYEAYRRASRKNGQTVPSGGTKKPAKTDEAPRIGKADARALLEIFARFGVPVAIGMSLLMWHNNARFHEPFEFGHRYLQVAWHARIEKWGLFGYHYLARNLSIFLAALPFVGGASGASGAPFQINVHGLALWFTSPFFLWALWPKKTSPRLWAFVVTILVMLGPLLLYQNSGWIQFGYRFSNDFAPFVMVVLALGKRKLSVPFWIAGGVALLVNTFGAVTFQKPQYAAYYFLDGSQKILLQPD